METVNSITLAASRLVFGDTSKTDDKSSQEPISGECGDVKAGEPYDKGNEEVTSEPKSLARITSKEIASDSTSNLPSTAAHSTPLPEQEEEPERSTAATLHKDEKTDSPTKASLKNLEEKASKGDSLLSAKKVDEGEGVKTGVKSTSDVPASTEPDTANHATSEALAASSSSSTPSPRKSESSSDGKGKDGKQKMSLKQKLKSKLHKH